MSPAPHHPRGIPIAELGLPPRVLRKVTADRVITDTFDLRVLGPEALSQVWNFTAADVDRINKALIERGMRPLEHSPDRPPRGAPRPGCPKDGIDGETCGRPKMKGKRVCAWHHILSQPISDQIRIMDARAERTRAKPGHVERARVPESEWPEGGRWCSECQAFVPWIYVSGTKCKAHTSRATHASMIKRVYDLSAEDYQSLLEWQGGRCYICGNYPRAKRLAIDHDHRTGAVRGLLCANDEWGCNMSLRRLLNSLEMAQRALEYVTKPPYARMLEEQVDVSTPEQPGTSQDWNPFG